VPICSRQVYIFVARQKNGDRNMSGNRKVAARVPALAVTATAATVCAVTIGLSRPEAVLDRSFEVGLAVNARPIEQVARTQPALADSPYFRLSKSEPNRAPGLASRVKIGDRITVSSQSREHSVLEVIDIRDIDGHVTHSEAAAARPGLLLVSCKVLGSPGDQVVRFIVEADEADSAMLGTQSPRAL
jgi:hypothetical protein